uniref:Uncharacterized protein n=1 Tax=Cacopsylla melanoneura TaxID=428564 RepID=A0A8D9E6J7_9HEMI
MYVDECVLCIQNKWLRKTFWNSLYQSICFRIRIISLNFSNLYSQDVQNFLVTNHMNGEQLHSAGTGETTDVSLFLPYVYVAKTMTLTHCPHYKSARVFTVFANFFAIESFSDFRIHQAWSVCQGNIYSR